MLTTPEDAEPNRVRRGGLPGGVAAFLLMRLMPGPADLSPEAWAVAAVLALMAAWWLTEAVPIPVTALVPLVAFPSLGVASAGAAAAPYANELIFLFMGGFFLAAAMEKWGVHIRIALGIMRRVGGGPARLLLGFMAATAFLSMWISNTAAAAMMLPIGVAVGTMFRPEGDSSGPYHFGIALMLGIAYAATIGGLGTLIGSPPNAMFAAAARDLAGVQVGFLEWMLVGVPLGLVLLPLTWLILLRLHPPGDLQGDATGILERKIRALGPASKGERFVTTVFVLAVAGWVLRAPKDFGAFTIPGLSTWFPGITDSTVAVLAGLVLLTVPVDRRRWQVALDWETAQKIPWGVLLLFGGGLSLAEAISGTGLAAWIGGGVEWLAILPHVLAIAGTAVVLLCLTEVASNTAVAAMTLPVMAGVAVTLGMSPTALMAAATISCSLGFMMPVGTPPNAIVFGSGYLTIGQMLRAGLWVNLISILLVTVMATTLIPFIFG